MLLQYSAIACVIYFLSAKEVTGYNLTVKTEHGYVRGYEETSSVNEDVKYYAFKGVPFGEPPVGSLRFQDPVPVSSWDGVKEATEFGKGCPIYHNAEEGLIGDEDCLYLDVYVPKTEKGNNELALPVMVWIHGGGFVGGTANSNPSFLIEKSVIMVSVSYRLSVIGFLSTLDENAHGNAGLKDQVLALKWVQNNIAYFGGNPKKVTIFGESAGGASVEYQLVSPLSAGLFSQAISESGSSLNEWAFQKSPKELTFKLAHRLGINSTNTKEVIEALQKVDVVTLIDNARKSGSFLPCVENDSEGAFISSSTYDLWSSRKFNKVPVLIGYNSEEGSYAKSKTKQYEEDPKNVIPAGLNIDRSTDGADEIVEEISARYFPNSSYDNFTNIVNFMTQHYFVRGIRKTVADLVKVSSPIYFYKYTYVSKGNYTTRINGGAGHGDETRYLMPSAVLIEEDVFMKNRMVTMWSNFAIHGNPTPEKDEVLENVIWPEATEDVSSEDDIRYLEIGDTLIPGTNPDQEDFLFWRSLFEKYAKSTIYTY